jgi:hypothetical protein
MLSYHTHTYVSDSKTTILSTIGAIGAEEVLTSFMDYGQPTPQPTYRHRLHGRQSSPQLPQIRTPERRSQPYSSPLPQTQWSDVDITTEPRGMLLPDDARHERRRAHNPPSGHLKPLPPLPKSSQTPENEATRHRRKIRGFRNLLSREKDEPSAQPANSSMLYPQLNPYSSNDRLSISSSYSAPDDLEYHHSKNLSQTSGPSRLYPPMSDDDRLPMSVPRSPTYPPAGRGRMHSATGVGDAAFADEQEFRLFVEATAGLGPEQFWKNGDSPTISSPRRTRSERVPQVNIHPAAQREMVSPLSDTPTTRYALHQLAQMPEGSPHLQPQRSYSAFDERQQSSYHSNDEFDISPLDEFEDRPPDDELPDYAESQAQAQQHQRAEAARRAQELQMRWQLSGARRGL